MTIFIHPPTDAARDHGTHPCRHLSQHDDPLRAIGQNWRCPSFQLLTLVLITFSEWAGLDLGSPEANLARWNSTTPPRYLYEPITSPVALFWGENDWLVVPEDEKDLAKRLHNLFFIFLFPLMFTFLFSFPFFIRLPNLVSNTRVDDDGYTHLDFLWAMHNRRLLYQPTLELMKQYP